MLLSHLHAGLVEAGCDEAGRGCLAGPVFAAAVILPPDFADERINDSKKLTAAQRNAARKLVEKNALAWAVAALSPDEIDTHNILRSSFLAMHRALDQLKIRPEHLLIDGNRFLPYGNLPHDCIIKGDGKYLSIAAAGILAKTHRDAYMAEIAEKYPHYGWQTNQGYPTKMHRAAIAARGACKHHRQSFRLLPEGQTWTLCKDENQ